jgi:putative glutamine amidotransferase
LAAKTIAVPTLAICRGLQILNVALGGTLIQDIPSERPTALAHSPGGPRDRRVHAVRANEGSRLAEALGASDLEVNSSHHQALDRVAPGIRVTATAPDGIVEGAESADDRWWMLGVQWHPEELTATAEAWDRALFEAFRRAAAAHAAIGTASETAPAATATGSTAFR